MAMLSPPQTRVTFANIVLNRPRISVNPSIVKARHLCFKVNQARVKADQAGVNAK
jgi:hypothetical protein